MSVGLRGQRGSREENILNIFSDPEPPAEEVRHIKTKADELRAIAAGRSSVLSLCGAQAMKFGPIKRVTSETASPQSCPTCVTILRNREQFYGQEKIRQFEKQFSGAHHD